MIACSVNWWTSTASFQQVHRDVETHIHFQLPLKVGGGFTVQHQPHSRKQVLYLHLHSYLIMFKIRIAAINGCQTLYLNKDVLI